MLHALDEMIRVMMWEHALKNPRSSVALNEWLEETLDNRMEAFTSVNRFLRDMVDRLEQRNAELQAKLDGLRSQEEVNKILQAENDKLEKTNDKLEKKNEKLEVKHDQLLQQLLSVRSTMQQ